MNPSCPIDQSSMNLAFKATVLNRHEISYYHCPSCGLIQTEKPYWLEEAYQSVITDTDTGLVARNILHAEKVATILRVFNWQQRPCLDLAGGYGLLTRLLRDRGFDAFTHDPYCANLFAKSFEPKEDQALCPAAIFAFEALEHLENPLDFIQKASKQYDCKTFILSTETYEGEPPSLDWWYYLLETGQHIAFYQEKTLHCLAEKIGARYYPIHYGFHLITDQSLSDWQLKIIRGNRLRKLFMRYHEKKFPLVSKTWEDHLKMKAHLQGKHTHC